jgi:hypothetical protein
MVMNKERELLRRISSHSGSAIPAKFIYEIQELLAQPEQEPVAWMWEQQSPHSGEWDSEFAEGKPQNFRVVRNIRPLYTSPQKREPLTDSEISHGFRVDKDATNAESYWAGVKLAEKAHGIGVDDEY